MLRKNKMTVKEIEKLVEDGFKEVILIGIDLSTYGEDFQEKDNFEALLEDILKIKNLKRVRLVKTRFRYM